ncbi:FecR domain-containing protein [Bradyrhizobium liaoningense]|uniref:FecR domain-containing protein n=1 Tax=Bradyrhizobium liaoningense TaxID=43992 RepID=UPI001BA72D6B|nr:FecR domain-containing protein [Bradyrhizobium liaoningense]MBR0709080.1 FecR domain-containing protein [Bradyrhizobium liaoningense]
MNYAGKFDAAIPFHGEGSHSPAYVHVDSFTAKAHGHVPAGAVVVPDPNLIFNGDFKRSGLDLVLSHEGRDFVVHDYFRGEKRAALASSDGAHLTGDVVNALTGHVQVAQAAPGTAAAQVIGHVTKLSGSATAIRNGVSVILNNGDNVEKGDVVSTGADSTLGITFIDGTVFGLSSNARMVLNEMVYDPNGSNNSSLLSLVAGTITFVAGETAKHGDMKVDTPVATMGIRGTAVLTQINFVVPAGGGDPQPQASFQVLVEPNGTTGSYILFDKITLLPIATVNQAGQMIQISGGNVSISNALMSPDVQKLITDVFTLKFTDNNSNTKLTNFTDTITPITQDVVFKSGAGDVAIATFTNLNRAGSEESGGSTSTATRIPGQPLARSLDLSGNVNTAFSLSERAGTTGDTTHSDTISGRITFVDQNLGDRPTVSISLAEAPNYVYKNAGQQDVTGSLSALQKQDIAATLIDISVVPAGGNNNNGSAVWTYTIPDNVFDFLAAGETLTLTYMVRVDTNFLVNPESAFIPITITITGTNDKPVITSSVPTITFEGGTSVPGGPLISDEATSGTLNFNDVDLTDTHTVSVALTSATLPDGSTVPPGPLAAFQSAMSVAIVSGADSTGDGTGTINWSLADLPVYLADFIPKGEVLTLVYTVTVTDAQGATAQQTITVTITGTDAPAVVWIATEKPGAPSGGFWKDAANWATGTVPTIDDDVIVITDQLHGLTPSFPATIDAPAYAKSITMNDFGGPPPQLINQSSLTIAGSLDMRADSIFTNAATGTASVGGLAEILDTSVLTNAGHLTLKAGGDFAVGTTITNSGTLEVFGGTLKTLAEIHNAGGTLKTDAGATLIVDGTTVDGGTVTILGTLELDGVSLIENGTLNNSGTVNVKGFAEFAGQTVDNTSSGVIEVLANGWLTIHQGSGVTNAGQITIDSSGRLVVNNATIGGAGEVIGTLNGEDEGGPIFNAGLQGAGTITNNGEMDLTGDAVLSCGILNNNALFNVSGTGNALSDETVTNAGLIEVLAGGALVIDQGSTVDNSSGNVVVDGNAALTLDDATISGGAIKGAGTIDVTGASRIDGGATLSVAAITVDGDLTLSGVSLTGGALTIQGTLESTGATTISDASITNNGLIEAIGGVLTLAAMTSASIANAGTLRANGAELDIDHQAVTNTGTLAATDGGTLKLISTTVTNGTGAVSVALGSALDLVGTVIDGGTLTIAGTLESTGTSAIDNADITNTGTIAVTGGTLTIDPATIHAVTNQGLIEAVTGGTLKLTAATITNTGGTISVDGTSKLYLTGVSINGGSLSNAGNLYSVSGSNTIAAGVTNTGGSIEVQAGTLNLAGGITGAGALIIADGATLELGGADAQTVTFAGGTGTLQLDKVAGQSFTGTITGEAAADGTITVTGDADIAASVGDALDVSMSKGTHASVALTLSGTLTGASNGIDVTQNGAGDVSLTATGDITGSAGHGIWLSDGSTATGNITVNDLTGKATGIGADSAGVLVENSNAANGGDMSITQLGGAVGGAYGIDALTWGSGDITIDAGGTITGSAIYGIRSRSYGTGSQTVTTEAGSVLTSGSSGIVAVNFAAAIDDDVGSTISVEAHGTIHSGSALNNDLTTPGAIIAGYKPGGNGAFSGAVNGDVIVTSDAAITADAGYGIEAFTWGVGDITVTTGAISQITAAGTAIAAFDHGGGDVTVTNNGSASGAVGLSALAAGAGDVTIVNHGSITGTSSAGIRVTQNDANELGDPVASGSTHITNTGSIVGATGHAAIFIQENATGSATIDNSGTIGPAAASSVTAATYAIVETGGAVTINNSGHINGNISVASATFNNLATGIWTVSGTSVFGNVSSIVNGGEIDLLNGASISVAGLGITNTNEIESWGTASITGTITNNHSIEVHTGTLTLFGSLSGSGSVTIDAGATLEIKNAVAQTITFAGDGAGLEIDTATFGGSIAGFAANEKIDLSTITWDSGTATVYDSATGNLVVSDAYGHSISLKLIGDYSDTHFITSSDGAGGTIVEIAPVDEWTNPAGGDWNTASNWSLGVPAASYDVKLLAGGEPITVDSATNVTIHDLTVASGVTLLTEPGTVFTVNGAVVLDGLVEAGPFSGNDVSTIDIKGNVTGTGAIEISNKAVVEIEGSVAGTLVNGEFSGITVYYDNGLGTLILDDSKDFHGLISGSPAGAPLSSNNLIDLKDLAWTSTMSAQADYNADTNITTVGFYNGTTTVTLLFLGRDVNWHLQSDGQGGTTVYDPLADTPMTIESGTVLNLSEASSQDVTFANDSGTTGTLAIEHAADFTGTINGFAGDGTVANSDLIDLKDIDFAHLTGVVYTENADHLGGVLTLSDGTETANIKFAGSYSIDSFEFVSDGNGGTLVVDPPTGPTLVGTSGQDQFAFTNSTLPVQSTIVDFELGQDKIDLREFAGIKSFSDIVITQQAGGALVTLDDHQSILLKNLAAGSLHASDFIVATHA